MKYIKYLLPVFFLVFATSCGSKKLVTGAGVVSEDATAASVIQKHYEEELEFNTLQAKLRVQYEDESNAHNLSVSLRMEKDKTIWMSGSMLGISLAKVMITPTRVQYYEKLGGTYFDGDFKLLSNWLGLPLDFEKVQNLLIGQALYNLRNEAYVSEESSRGYQLSPANQNAEVLKRMFLISPSSYKIMAEQISQPQENRHATISYPEYQKIGDKLLPNQIVIMAGDSSGNTKIDIEFNNVDLNPSVTFPFSIPSGYEEISIR